MIQKGTVIFAAPDDDTGVDDARLYIKIYSLDGDQVRIVKRSDMVVVETKKEIDLAAKRDESCADDTDRMRGQGGVVPQQHREVAG